MNAMILAAGRGERLRPYTDTCPKPLLEVNHKPLIDYHLEALARAGIKQVVINTSWLGDAIEAAVGNGDRYGLDVVYSREPEALETAGGIIQALPLLDDRFLVVNADIFTDYRFEGLRVTDAEAHLVLVENPSHNPSGDFVLSDGRLRNEGRPKYTFAGIASYAKSFFDELTPGKRALAPLLQQAADAGRLHGELYQGSWDDIGTLERWQSV